MADGWREERHALRRDAGVSELELQIGEDGREVRVAATLAEAAERALHMRGAGADGGYGVGHGKAAVVMCVDADGAASAEAVYHRARGLRHLLREGPAIRLAKAHHGRAGLGRRSRHAHRQCAVVLPSEEEMLGIEDDAFPMRDEPCDGLPYHALVLVGRRAEDLADVHAPRLADERDDASASVREGRHLRI